MNDPEYKYDVAFSFLKEDEGIATQLNDLLKDRFKTFLYSEKQKELAGRDGEKMFNDVFQKESRTVVVLYRDNWGKTPWTRIEETAVRNRVYEKGYEFVTFVPLDDKAKVPDWLPKVRLYIGLKRYGLESTAAIIESRIIEKGGVQHVETSADKAERIEREIERKRDRINFLNSHHGVSSAYQEFKNLQSFIKTEFEKIKERKPDWHLRIQHLTLDKMQLISYGFTLGLGWHLNFSNTLDQSYLYVGLFNGVFDDNGGHDPIFKPKRVLSQKFDFGQNDFDELVWIDREDTSKKYTSEMFGQHLVGLMLDQIQKDKMNDL